MTLIRVSPFLGIHPRLRDLARILEIPPVIAQGHLFELWAEAAVFFPNGDLSGLNNEQIAAMADWPVNCDDDANTFVRALIRSGWLGSEDSVLMHNGVFGVAE